MITHKLYKILFVFFLLTITQCYKAPFFELSVEVINENLEPVANCAVSIEITDLDTGNIISGEILNSEYADMTNDAGTVIFSFENKAFVTARACFLLDEMTGMCKQGHVYLEDNETKTLTLMIEENNCNYCF
tara:strand:- start:140 stop:535 length:396 start_codon:yes stop_codon:yes gene_type:complete